MDPLTILQNRIEQLEAKLGMNANFQIDGQRGDSAVENLLNTATAISNATADHEKLKEATKMASELNNYLDPNYVENVQQNEMHKHEVAAAEPIIRHHCQCMQHCKKAAPVLDSEPLQQVPQSQAAVNQMQLAASEVKAEADIVSQGVEELAETCGTAALEASEQLAQIASKVDQVEEKMFPKRRNGLD